MSKLSEMIATLCPNGVEYKRIGSFAECFSGATPKTGVKQYWDNGTIPWMSSGEVNQQIVTHVEKRITKEGYDSCSTRMVPVNSVVIALAGQGKTRGLVALTRVDLCTNQSLCAIVPNASVLSEYLYYYLQSRYQDLRAVSSGDGTRGGLNLKMVRDYLIPVPPLPIQREIVQILDNFANLTAELTANLTAELAKRKKQYEHYRDMLLNFEGGGQI